MKLVLLMFVALWWQGARGEIENRACRNDDWNGTKKPLDAFRCVVERAEDGISALFSKLQVFQAKCDLYSKFVARELGGQLKPMDSMDRNLLESGFRGIEFYCNRVAFALEKVPDTSVKSTSSRKEQKEWYTSYDIVSLRQRFITIDRFQQGPELVKNALQTERSMSVEEEAVAETALGQIADFEMNRQKLRNAFGFSI